MTILFSGIGVSCFWIVWVELGLCLSGMVFDGFSLCAHFLSFHIVMVIPLPMLYCKICCWMWENKLFSSVVLCRWLCISGISRHIILLWFVPGVLVCGFLFFLIYSVKQQLFVYILFNCCKDCILMVYKLPFLFFWCNVGLFYGLMIGQIIFLSNRRNWLMENTVFKGMN